MPRIIPPLLTPSTSSVTQVMVVLVVLITGITTRAVADQTSEAREFYWRGYDSFQQRQYQEAIDAFENSYYQKPNSVTAYFLAHLYREFRMGRLARKFARACLRDYPRTEDLTIGSTMEKVCELIIDETEQRRSRGGGSGGGLSARGDPAPPESSLWFEPPSPSFIPPGLQ